MKQQESLGTLKGMSLSPLTPLCFHRRSRFITEGKSLKLGPPQIAYGESAYITGCGRFIVSKQSKLEWDTFMDGIFEPRCPWILGAHDDWPGDSQWNDWLEYCGLDAIGFSTRTEALHALYAELIVTDLLQATKPFQN